MNLILWLIVFAISLIALVKSANIFTKYSEKLGHVLGMPQFIVGVLIVAIGTSLPELATSLSSVWHQETGMVAGNVLGTVIANILLGLGLAAIFSKRLIKMKWDISFGDLPLYVGAIILVIFTMLDGVLTWKEALLFLFGYLIYFFYSLETHRQNKKSSREKFHWPILVFMGISLVVVIFASNWLVKSTIEMATILGFGTSVLATSLIAVGTSLPEISVALAAARRGNYDLLVGNIIGSNIFDIFVIFGIAGLVSPLNIPQTITGLVIPAIIAVSVLYWVITSDKKITRTEGILMVLIYILFLGKLFNFI
ncbi:calcium/sodium antiporter [Patescibacteria group bacterium]|nr:calcium/sodium antiporter [Patescibacteria group bacterium]